MTDPTVSPLEVLCRVEWRVDQRPYLEAVDLTWELIDGVWWPAAWPKVKWVWQTLGSHPWHYQEDLVGGRLRIDFDVPVVIATEYGLR